MELPIILIAALSVMIASLTGVVFVWGTAGAWLQSRLRYLVTFAAGVFIIVSYSLFSEALELTTDVSIVILGAILGAAVLELTTRLIDKTHHHHGPTDSDHQHSIGDARRVLIGDAIHNIADGILLVPVFMIDIRLGIATAIGIFLHEAVQEASEFFILKEAGYSTRRALTLNFIVSSTILIGVGIGLYAVNISVLVPALIAFAAGAFLYVVFRDLLPSTFRAVVREGAASTHLMSGALGILLMFGVNIATPHEHHGHNGHDEHASHEHHHDEDDIHEDEHNEHVHQ